MPTLTELQEKRASLAAEIRKMGDAFNDNGKQWKSAEERGAWEKVNADYNANMVELDAAQKREAEAVDVERRRAELDEHDSRSRDAGRVIPGNEDTQHQRAIGQVSEETRSLAMAGFLLGPKSSRCTDRHHKAMQSFGINPNWQEIDLPIGDSRTARQVAHEVRSKHFTRIDPHAMPEQRTLSSITSGAGGAMVFPSFVRQLELNMLAYGGMRQVAETIRTTSGERMTWPTANDTGNTGRLIAEGQQYTGTDPSFQGVSWDAFKFSSDVIKVPYELLEDAAFDLPSLIGQMLGERLGRITNTKFTTGTAANEPKGIITAASLGYTTASATAITFDEVIRLQHSIDPAYRVGASWMMHDSITLALRLLKDSYGRYVWQDGAQDNRPDMLFGAPVTINQDMDSAVTTTKKTILYGQLSKYKIRTVNSIRLRRLDERDADYDLVDFVAFVREDGNLLDAGTAPVKYLQQA